MGKQEDGSRYKCQYLCLYNLAKIVTSVIICCYITAILPAKSYSDTITNV